ncbi:MAG: SpoIVB peptidase S55 domain-containing protein [Thermoanaerobaculia bacterium]
MHKILCSLLVFLLPIGMGAETPTPSQTADEEMFPLDSVQPGLTGYGLSVFEGAIPERFEVEVLGVWRNTQPSTSFILARLKGRGLEASGVIAGMSGSPVYVDGRLLGAVSFSWLFANEAVAGITPIEQMRHLSAGESSTSSSQNGSRPREPRDLISGSLTWQEILEPLGSLEGTGLDSAISGVQWSTVGFGSATRATLKGALDSLSAAGQASDTGDLRLVAGSSVSGVLVDGDLRLAATGTVTERRGDEILAFGHPFLGVGPLRVPMAASEVVTVVSSQMNSFKISNLGAVVGAFEMDRAAGMRGRVGAEAPMIPVSVRIAGLVDRQFALRVADLPLLTPTLVAISTLGSLEAASQSSGSQGLDLEARFDLAEWGELEIRQSFDGELASQEAAFYLFAFTGFFLNNRFERINLESIDIELEQHAEPRTARLVGAHVNQTLVRPGDRIELVVDLQAYRGETFRATLALDVPTGLPEGRYSLLVGDGVSVDMARLEVEKTTPQTFPQALRFLRSFHSSRELVALGVFRGEGLSVGGEVLPQLPASVRSLWSAAPSTSATPLRLAVAQESVIELDQPLEGIVRVDLEVQREGPLKKEPAEGDSPAAGGGLQPSTPTSTGTEGGR